MTEPGSGHLPCYSFHLQLYSYTSFCVGKQCLKTIILWSGGHNYGLELKSSGRNLLDLQEQCC